MVRYELMDKLTGEIPSLDYIDKQMCLLLGKPYNRQQFCYIGNKPEYAEWLNWNTTVGLAMAMGKTWDQIRELWSDNDEILAIVDFLERNYEVICWRN